MDDVDLMYSSLGCQIHYISPTDKEHKKILDLMKSSEEGNTKDRVTVKNVYSLKNISENLNFKSSLDSRKLLFHGTKIGYYSPWLAKLIPQEYDRHPVQRSDAAHCACARVLPR